MSAHHEEGPVVPKQEVQIAANSGWRRAPIISGVIGIAALGAAFALKGEGEASQQFYMAYLTALMTFLAIGLGGFFFTLIQHATRAGWSIVVRRIAEHLGMTLPLLGLLALPVVFIGTHDLFHWSHPGVTDHDPVLAAKAAYLNEGSFRLRAIIYLVVWVVVPGLLWLWSTKQDHAKDPRPYSARSRFWSPLGLLLFGLSLTFAAFDWLMSLDPHWFSTIFGVYYFAGTALSSLAFIVLVVLLLHRSGYLRGVVTMEHFHDLGKLMFGFTVFWAYMAFSQYMLIWYASIPEETGWYMYRGQGSWLALSIVLVFVRFAIPFLGLLSRTIKRRPAVMMAAAIWLLAAQYVDMFWLIHPPIAHANGWLDLRINVQDVLTLVGIGGIWYAAFAWLLVRHPLVPLQDPRLQESVHFENF